MNFTQDTTNHEDDIPNQEEIITSEQNNHEETITTEQNNTFNHEGIISNSGMIHNITIILRVDHDFHIEIFHRSSNL
jgi:hypothetical protein